MTSEAVQLEAVGVAYGAGDAQVEAVESVSLSIHGPQIVAIVGPSGCGKTTLLQTIAGFFEPARGTATVFGVPPVRARRNGWIAVVSQRPALLSNRTVEKNVGLPLELAGQHNPEAIESALRVAGLLDRRDAYPHQLSGGMKQRAAFARAYAFHPRLLLLDEPFNALDELRREKFNEDFWGQQRLLRQTTLLVTHSIEEAVFLADRVIVLSSGPARVLHDLEIEAPESRDAAFRDSTAYFETVSTIRQLLRTV